MSATIGTGSVLNVTSIRHVVPGMQLEYRAPKGTVFVVMLMGIGDKKAPDAFDPEKALRNIGWVPESDPLVAAAPDLLVVAHEFLEALAEQGLLCECGEVDCRTSRARAAIAKAKREQS